MEMLWRSGGSGGRGPGGIAQAMLEFGEAWGGPVQAACKWGEIGQHGGL